MIVTKVIALIPQVAAISGYSETVVASVVTHYFKCMRHFLMYPTKAGIRIPYIGIIRTKLKRLNFYLRRDAVRYYREGYIDKARLQCLWKLRDLTRKDEQRRDFKTRYGLRFEPTWRQNTGSIEPD